MAELREDVLVLGTDDPSRPYLKGDVVTFETIALDGDGELPLPICSDLKLLKLKFRQDGVCTAQHFAADVL